MAPNDDNKDTVKGSAFGVCAMRTTLSLLPAEAGDMKYDKKTPKFEGVALEFNPDKEAHGGFMTIKGCQKSAADFPALLKRFAGQYYGGDEKKNWGGFDFGIARAHAVDNVIVQATTAANDSQPIRQIVFCGVGQDYRGMRYGELLQSRGVKVFELDLPAMMTMREKVKTRIREENDNNLVLPQTFSLSIDFDTQSVSEVLLACSDFDAALPTLFVWEGVSYYLIPEAMKKFLVDVHGLMCQAPEREDIQKDHLLFFDYLIDLPTLAEKGDLPAEAMLKTFENSSEPLLSFIDFDNVETYLSSVGFYPYKQMLPPDMYKPYQTPQVKPEYSIGGSDYFGMVIAKPK